MHAGDLADHPIRVDHRQARLHALLCAAIEDDLAREGVGRVVQDVGRDAAGLDPARHLQQLAQVRILLLQVLETQQALTGAELVATQVGVL